jgi:hypothetical protein
MRVVKEYFKTLESMVNIMDQRTPNKPFLKKETLLSMREDDDPRPWAGTGRYSDAVQLIKSGYSDPLKRMKTAVLKHASKQTAEKRIRYDDVVGFMPNVPNALRGVPLSMINQKRTPKKINTIHLIYSFCVSASVKPEQMIRGGINFISLVNMLEKQGYRVKIDITFITLCQNNKEVAGFLVNAKEYNQSLNLLKLSFPLVHPSMLRRIAFKWLETTPDLKQDAFIFGYGVPITAYYSGRKQQELDFLKKHGFLTGNNTYYCTAYDAFETKSVEALADRLGITH